MYPFSYVKATSAKNAVTLLGKKPDAKILAGGHTLLPTMKQRLASPETLIDIGGAGLSGIELKGKVLTIGATTTHNEVATSAVVQEAIPALAALASGIGDPHVRHRGTIGGSVANNDPAADYPAACLGLGATIITNKRRIAADDYFQGLFTTALAEDEIILRISFPVPSKAAYVKFDNPASRYALCGVFVAKKGNSARVAVTGAGSSGVYREAGMEAALNTFNAKSIEGMKANASDMLSDMHGSADYRAHLVGVMAKRAVNIANGK
jgi:aerobic carbon-monoxide dehydrogenase medium subunit